MCLCFDEVCVCVCVFARVCVCVRVRAHVCGASCLFSVFCFEKHLFGPVQVSHVYVIFFVLYITLATWTAAICDCKAIALHSVYACLRTVSLRSKMLNFMVHTAYDIHDIISPGSTFTLVGMSITIISGYHEIPLPSFPLNSDTMVMMMMTMMIMVKIIWMMRIVMMLVKMMVMKDVRRMTT